jgi:hypothetical protein
VVDLSDAPPAACQALQREASVVLAVSGECRHSCQYKGATIKGNRFCLIMKRYSKSLARVIAEAGTGKIKMQWKGGVGIGSKHGSSGCCAGVAC